MNPAREIASKKFWLLTFWFTLKMIKYKIFCTPVICFKQYLIWIGNQKYKAFKLQGKVHPWCAENVLYNPTKSVGAGKSDHSIFIFRKELTYMRNGNK